MQPRFQSFNQVKTVTILHCRLVSCLMIKMVHKFREIIIREMIITEGKIMTHLTRGPESPNGLVVQTGLTGWG